ncbi:hypothetical protein [Aquibacillus albus]|uniref:DUF4025 domain-containing protein n=1 Tax=Aquibacillus albus TaxID=1168171 RepID=A0ABS2N536_9BACI|nr:hypothetical protein [Aquibacillus albus]MBM7573226.1 hypothetical protein [Aquibacillus albus]
MKKHNPQEKKVAPNVDPDEDFGEKATQSEIEQGEYTKVTRLSYDEYEHSEE